MKKTTAALAAGTIGVIAAGAGAAGSAQALPAVDCAGVAEHVVATTATPDADWYMDCVPQYGLGKAAFELESDVPLPAEFSIEDADMEITSDLDPAAAAYLQQTLEGNAFVGLNETESGNSRQYIGALALPIASVGALDIIANPGLVPAQCGPAADFPSAFQVSYTPVNVSFDQVIAGEDWSADATLAPTPLNVAFTPDYVNGAVGVGPVCAWTDDTASNDPSVAFSNITSQEETPPFNNAATLAFAVDGEGLFGSFLGSFPITTTAVIVTPPGDGDGDGGTDPAAGGEVEELAETGAEATAPAIAAGAAALLGAALMFVSGARRRRAERVRG